MTTTLPYTIRCDDRRYCANGSITLPADTEHDAHQQARQLGWEITALADVAICPACLNKKHPRKDQP